MAHKGDWLILGMMAQPLATYINTFAAVTGSHLFVPLRLLDSSRVFFFWILDVQILPSRMEAANICVPSLPPYLFLFFHLSQIFLLLM